MIAVVRRRPLTVFFVLACLFGWGIWIAHWLGASAEPDNMPLGPLAAAAIVTALQGREDFRAWGRTLLRWAASPWLWAVVVALPVLIDVLVVLIDHGLGAPLPTGAQLAGWTALPGTFVMFLVMVGIGEEAGWSAFAAPLLLRRHGLLVAWALMSTMRILWHLPLLISGDMPLVLGLVGNAGFQLVILWVLQASRGCWSLAAVLHAVLNTVGSGFFFSMVTGADRDRLGVLFGLAWGVAGLLTLTPLARRAITPGPAPLPAPTPPAAPAERRPLSSGS